MEYLPAEQRRALVLTHVNGYSYDEVAQMECTAIGTVKSRVNRAILKLKEYLADERFKKGRVPKKVIVPLGRKKKLVEHVVIPPTYPVRQFTSEEKTALVVLSPSPMLVSVITNVAQPVREPVRRLARPQLTIHTGSVSFPITTHLVHGNTRIRSTVLRRCS
jgi:hypothetical protein